MIALPAITRLAITPVKGTRLREVGEIELGRGGARGDREFFLIDAHDRMVNGKQLGELQRVVASYEPPRLAIALPDGREVAAPVELGKTVTARLHSRTVTGRVVRGPWSEAISELAGRPLRLVAAPGAVDRGARGAVTLVSRASLEAFASAAGIESVDPRRFRMLIEINGVAAHEEDGWVGRSVRIGADVVVALGGHVGRCLVTTRHPETGLIDLPTLDVLRDYRGAARTTAPLAFGVFGEVSAPGRVRVGDRLALLPPGSTPSSGEAPR